ncbi:tripartite motif-containing protein 16-like [Periophthalmus magnuspinnatus]|uniref:tripartite motif-containing protein 16-like n=1 Tax=Periophthalmus magnuspinnatus TaxID=409849 RepID=UPI00145A0B3A|nr:tripartite motif-containing protein 16-like [Periophthalmus magnuspinnatus]
MAQAGASKEKYLCSICLDFLKYPVTIPCGHNYCMDCITNHWDTQRELYTCPQCRKYYGSRPILMKNTLLDELVEDFKTSNIQTPDSSPEDVLCDVCEGKKLTAIKSCMQCLASFCEKHLQPHLKSLAFAKHKLTEPSRNLQEGLCPRHNETMKMFCRREEQCICFLCSVNEHRGHDIVSVITERAQREKELENRQQNILQKITNREKESEILQEEEMSINLAADEAIFENNTKFENLICLIKQKKRDFERGVRTEQENKVRQVGEIRKNIVGEIANLKRINLEMELVSHISDDSLFLQKYLELSETMDTPDSDYVQPLPVQSFKDFTAAVGVLTNKLQNVLEGSANESVDDPAPQTREDFLKYAQNITLDLNTANTQLALADFNRRVTLIGKHIDYVHHPERFQDWRQVLSKQSLTGRCYWEVEWSGEEGVYVAVAYKSIKRQGSSIDCLFGYNDKSWALYCDKKNYVYWFNGVSCPVLGPRSTKIGVYLDHTAGVLAFYSVSQTMTLLHKVQVTFTQPLHAGLWLYYPIGITAAFCKLK